MQPMFARSAANTCKNQSIRLLCAAMMALGTMPASAQTAAGYPSKPVRVITPYPAGGSASVIARTFAESYARDFGHPFLVDNRPGASSIIGTQAVARAAPDGHTLLVISNTLAVIHWTIPDRPYDTLKDLVGVSTLVRNDHMIAVNPSFPAGNLREMIAYLKKNPGKVNAYTTAQGSINHLENLQFMQATGTNYTVVPYKGGGAGLTDLVSGTIQMAINTPNLFASFIKSGKLKGIALSGERRNPVLPEVPTFAEAGLKDFSIGTWYSLFAPGATPRDIVDKLNAATARAQASKDVQDILAKQAIDPFPSTVAATNALMRVELDMWGKVVKEFDVKPEAD